MQPSDLTDFRTRNQLTQKQLGELLGYKENYVQRAEVGKTPLSGPLRAKFARLLADESPLDGERAEPDGPPSGFEGGQAADSPPGVGDLPPLADPPPPPGVEDDGDTTVRLGSGKTVTVRSLGHFGRIEMSMLVFFTGKNIEYAYPTADGKVAMSYVHQPGLADFVPDPRDGAVIREHAPAMAHAWAEWAKTNGRVNWFLSFFVLEGGAKGVISATIPVVLTIMGNHGIDPLSFFLAPLDRPSVTGRSNGGEPADAAADDDGNPWGGIGFSNADGVDP